MKTTVTTTEAQANLPRLLKQLAKRKALTITHHGRIAAFLVSQDRLEVIFETRKMLTNPEAIKAIRDSECGKSKGRDISCLD